MSILFKVKEDDSNLLDIIDGYEKALAGFGVNLKISGKSLELANVEHVSWMSYYDERRIELSTLVKHYDKKINATRGNLWVGYTESFSIALTARDKDMYINKDQRFLDIKELFLIVEEMYKKYESVVELFKQRGFALRNITNLRVAAMEDVIL